MDTLTSEQRSAVMSRIRSKNTKPELVVRRHLHALGFRYRLHDPKLPGHPDIVLRKWHTVVLVHGCFWHRHEGCKTATMPKSNVEFWTAKFQRNVERDARNRAALEAAGWKVIVLWECEIKEHLHLLADRIKSGSSDCCENAPKASLKPAKCNHV
ncbi:MAG: DNA mismatch endonuclease Vsr [Lentisphaerae bacterium]|nr:DNA mismatch endonuclease Vsr [Lentisphaerota bacterium]